MTNTRNTFRQEIVYEALQDGSKQKYVAFMVYDSAF